MKKIVEEALTEDEKEMFSAVVNADNVVLVRGSFRGKPAAYIAATVVDNAGRTALLPLALLLDQETLRRLQDDMRGPNGIESVETDSVVGIGPDEIRDLAKQEREKN